MDHYNSNLLPWNKSYLGLIEGLDSRVHPLYLSSFLIGLCSLFSWPLDNSLATLTNLTA